MSAPEPCAHCEGTGVGSLRWDFSSRSWVALNCPDCNGTGQAAGSDR